MNKLSTEYGPKGLVIIGCPCNQFGHQENLDENEILKSLKFVRPGKGYRPKFLISEKLEVNGEKQHQLFTILKLISQGAQIKKEEG